MIVESLAVLALVAGGSLLVRTGGVRGWAVPALGLVLGVALQVTITAVLGIAGVGAAAWVALAATLLAPATWWWRCYRTGEPVTLSPVAAGAVAVGVVASVAALRAADLVNATPDSFRYLATAGLLGSGRLREASAFLLASRLLAVPAMHAPATLNGELYLRSLTPLVAVACVGSLAWFVRTGLQGRVAIPAPTTAALVAAALLATNNRFVFHSFYLNGHLLLATWFLIIAGVSWLLLSESDLADLVPVRVLSWIVIVFPAIVLTRPDAGLMAGIALVPLLVSSRIPQRWRFATLLTLGGSITAWQSYLFLVYRAETEMPSSVPGLLVLGLAIVAASVVVRQAGSDWLPRRTLGLVEGALWVTLAVAVVLDPRPLLSSGLATLVNVFWDGGWGSSLLVLAALVVLVLIFTDIPGRVALRFPLTTFIPLSLLLAYLRGAAYREGPGDSLNRMLLQFVPIAILLVVTAVASDRIGSPRRRSQPVLETPAGSTS